MGNEPAKHLIEFIYINGSESRSCFSEHSNVPVSFNVRIYMDILPYIIGCFLKCKINYHKRMTQAQYDRIKGYIEQTKNVRPSYFDVKDIISLSSIEEIEEMLQAYGEGTIEWY